MNGLWYFEERGFHGRWRPVTVDCPPRGVNADGRKAVMRGVTEVPRYHQHLTLDQLRAVYSPDGNLRGTGK